MVKESRRVVATSAAGWIGMRSGDGESHSILQAEPVQAQPNVRVSPEGNEGFPATRFIQSLLAHDVFSRLIWIIFLALVSTQVGRAQSCGNSITCENALPGNPATEWDTSGSGDSDIQGFATDISVNVGQTVLFKIKTTASNYHLDIYRMGYYSGAGARKVATVTPSVSLPQTQPACLTDSTTNLIDCGNWAVSASWTVPSTSTSGLYFAHLVRPDNGHESHIFWVVRNDASHSDILYQTSDQTWAAYNDYGGHSLYGGPGTFDFSQRAFKVSYNRPSDTRNFEAATMLFNGEYPMIRWLEANGYDVNYFTGVDAARSPSLITNHKVYLSVGHDEYVSKESRTSIEAARDAGVNLAFFSGNEIFWKTRWENSIDGTNTPYRTMVCYKETYSGTDILYKADPADPPTWTGTWRDPRFSPPADGGRPENRLSGTLFMVNGPGPDNSNLAIQVPAADGKMRFWRNTSVASQSAGQTATLPAGTLGYEWDADIDNGSRPPGLVPLSTSTYTLTADLLLDYGGTYGGGNATHHLSLYRAPSGALVFGAGTVQWAWGLDSNHDGGNPNTADLRMQQATLNLFADMGVQPATMQPGLVAATKSTDTTAPTTAVTSPAAGSTVQFGSPITVTGTATDTGGGVVGAVEVSGDGGQTWHPAIGRGTWTYTWTPSSLSGSATLLARAADDSANLQATPTSVTYTVAGGPTCPCSIWSSSSVPGTASANDPKAVEVGLRFRSDTAGNVTGVRFYKGASNTGAHIGHLWSNQGTPLGTATFTNETASGWQQANFSAPIPISANTTYVISYYAPNGGYADDEPFFSGHGVDRLPLHALADGVDGANGVYLYNSGGGFPTNTFSSGNYWVDVVFALTGTRSISGNAGTAGATVTLTGTASASVTADSSGNYAFTGLANGGYTVTPTKTGFTFSPTSLTVTVSGADITGQNFVAAAAPTWSISGNAGTGGATVTLSGTANATVTADASGNYTFPTVVNGSYIVTPTKTGFAFTPANRSVTVNGANMTGVNFVANTVPTWSISGTISPTLGGAGTTVTLSGAATATATSDSSGNYTFTGLVNGTYTVTPGKVGFSFAPASQTVTVSGANVGAINFTATQGTSIWNNSIVPGTPAESDTGSVELGLKFRSDVAGSVTGVRFYKGTTNTGTHTGNLWTSTGTNLATVTFANETASGWQQAIFSSPVGISANTTYIVSYYAPNGHYAADSSFFATGGVDNAPLHALANGIDGGNGVYHYGGGGVFPADTYQSSNYWVDVVFAVPSGSSISGTISPAASGAGATVTLSGTASGTTTADASGNYTFTSLANGSYTVTPTKSGFTFSPASAPVTVNGANVTGTNFTATAASVWSISGTISPAASGAGATVTLSGTASATTTADASGNYTFTSLANGSYTVTPTKSGFTFSPASAPVTVNGANVTGTNFTATAASVWSISGTISPAASGAGATVTLSGGGSGTTTADASGNYTFTSLANGSYTVTPTKSGFTFSPASAPVTVNGANVTGTNFTATAASVWSISGTISPAASGAGATVTLSGTASGSTTADASGNYTFTSLANGSYTVTPTKSGFTFSPASAPVTVNGANVTGTNFTATAASVWSISGNAGTAAATVTLSGTANASVTADASGNYTFPNLANGSYTVTPTKSGFTFSPVNRPVTVNGANVTAINFIATAPSVWSISGTISPVASGAGATVTLSGAGSATTTADASGNYIFSTLANGTYTVTPTKTGFSFTPSNQLVVVSGADMAGVNFTAAAPLSMDAKVFADQATASTTVNTASFSTTAGNELLLAFISADWISGTNTVVSSIAGAGVTWALVTRTNTQSGSAEIWRAFAPSTLSNVVVTATLSHSVISSMTVMSFKNVDTSGTNGSGAIGATGTANARSGAPATSVVTTRSNSWVFGVGNDYDNATARTPGSGQSLVHQYLTTAGDTYWVQMQNNPTPTAGTTVTINDTAPTADRYNLSICEVLPAP